MTQRKRKSLKSNSSNKKKIKLNKEFHFNSSKIKSGLPNTKLDSISKSNLESSKLFIVIIIIILFLILISFAVQINPHITTINNTTNNTNNTTNVTITTVNLGNNDLGSVSKIGPYGNPNSPVKIAYILGVHPREKGSHQIMEQAIKNKSANLNYCYYIYKINVTKDPTEFSESRMNGQLLAQKYVVPDAIKDKYNFAIDVHYSDDSWGVTRFLFTPVENNTVSHNLGHAIVNKFDWISYYTPPDPTSPEYVTTPLNNGGVPAIVYEAYTNDARNTTYQHDLDLIDFIDHWNFNNNTNNSS